MFVTRQLIRSFIHGFFIFHYQEQILLLMSMDIIYVAGVLKMRRYFVSRFVFVFVILYNSALFVFDFYFFVEFFYPNLSYKIDR